MLTLTGDVMHQVPGHALRAQMTLQATSIDVIEMGCSGYIADANASFGV